MTNLRESNKERIAIVSSRADKSMGKGGKG